MFVLCVVTRFLYFLVFPHRKYLCQGKDPAESALLPKKPANKSHGKAMAIFDVNLLGSHLHSRTCGHQYVLHLLNRRSLLVALVFNEARREKQPKEFDSKLKAMV